MTPDERKLIQDLFDRMRAVGRIDKDTDAEALIHRAVNAHPDSLYILVQTALVQEHALNQSEQRMQDLEQEVAALRAQQPSQPQAAGGGSFLGGLFGGKPAAAQASAVPSSGSSPWGNRGAGAGTQSAGFQGNAGYPQGGGYQPAPVQQPLQQAAPAKSGGGFLAGAMTTAAGVAGGMLAANAIGSMLGGGQGGGLFGGGHNTAKHDQGTTPAAAQPNAQTASDDGLTEEDYEVDTADDTGSDDFGGGDDSMDV